MCRLQRVRPNRGGQPPQGAIGGIRKRKDQSERTRRSGGEQEKLKGKPFWG